ncbi:MAG: DUF934 domain-containing protein [Alphaproteobacteria bacterium]|nr:DUF934 domain-containing protein [Alphaproteobacteria bacterium]
MPLLKGGVVAVDRWQCAANGETLPADGPVIVPFVRWRAERETLIGRNAPVGVRLTNTDPVADLAPDLDRLELIVLEFPKFTDGRAYSQARLLRERYGYRGELRAAGNVLRDQLLFMQRCGFDAFELTQGQPVQAWVAATNEFTVFYQPAGDGRNSAMQLRRAAILAN